MDQSGGSNVAKITHKHRGCVCEQYITCRAKGQENPRYQRDSGYLVVIDTISRQGNPKGRVGLLATGEKNIQTPTWGITLALGGNLPCKPRGKKGIGHPGPKGAKCDKHTQRTNAYPGLHPGLSHDAPLVLNTTDLVRPNAL